jgi:Tol biopolymer transport system component
MFFPIAHVHRLAVSASLAFVVVLSTASGQIANVSELAFVRDGQIFRVRSDGTGLVQLTSDGVNSEATWAPDGARIAFVRTEGTSSDIYVMNADGSNVVRRTDGGGYSPAWSPDGTRIAFSSLRDGQYRIYVMRVDEDWWNPAPLGFDTGHNAHPAWSPDGSRIAFVSDWRAYDFLSELYVMNADGSNLRLVLSSPFFFPSDGHLVYYWQPAWSPDGGTIALTSCGFWNCFPDTVSLVNADGSGLRSIAGGAGVVARPSWSPDGTRIAFGSSACAECASAIHYVTKDGSQSGVLISDAHSPTWRPSTSGFDTLVASHSQKCLDVNGGSLDDGASIIQWQCHGGVNQQWRLEVAGDGYSRIVSRHSGKCLDVNGGSLDDGASIIQWQCHGGANQQWRLEAVTGGYRVVARHGGKCLDVSGESTDDGGSILQWSCHGGANQTWVMRPVNKTPPPLP